jgi:hypothetical protein
MTKSLLSTLIGLRIGEGKLDLKVRRSLLRAVNLGALRNGVGSTLGLVLPVLQQSRLMPEWLVADNGARSLCAQILRCERSDPRCATQRSLTFVWNTGLLAADPRAGITLDELLRASSYASFGV